MTSQAFEVLRDSLVAHGSTITNNHQGQFKATCPHHEDKNPSLSVTDKGDRVLVHCHANCGADEIMADLGLTLADLFDGEPSRDKALPIRSYLYNRPDGDAWFWKDRYWPKTFICRLPGTDPGDRTGLKGRNANLLYHAPQLLAGIKAGKTVWLVDGERDVETAERHGLVATTTPHGSGSRWDPKYTEALAAATEVVIVVDQDQAKPDGTLGAGQQHAVEARAAMRSVKVKVRLVAPAVGKDLTDHFDAGYTVDDFVPDTTAVVRPRGITGAELSTMTFAPVTYAINHVLPPGLAILAGSPKFGKAAALDTSVLTTAGWTTMGEIRPGMSVYAPDGRPTRVTVAHPVMLGRDCYRVTTRSGASVVVDGDHLWPVRQRGVSAVVRTADLEAGHRGRRWLLPVTEPVARPEADLPVDPWLLGYWLGNGTGAGAITMNAKDADEVLARVGPVGVVTQKPGAVRATVLGLIGRLRLAGVAEVKHIPECYLLASIDQRRALLAGLLDSDGYPVTAPNGTGAVEFTSTTEALADGVAHLCRSLGIKVAILKGVATLNGVEMGPKWRISLTASKSSGVVTLRRRVAALPDREPSQRSHRDAVVSVTPVPSVPVRCITVAHETGCFLIGRDLMVTHNSFCALSMGLGVAAGGRAMDYLECNQGSVLYLAREDSARRIQARIERLYQNSPPGHLEHIEIVPAEQPWTGGEIGLAAMTEWAEQVGNPRLVVLDTWAKVDPLVDDRDRYRTEYRLMASYKQWADLHGCTVLMIHHLRKSEAGDDDPFSQISGTRGITGAADTLIVVKAKRGSREGVMYLTGRDVAEQELELRKYGPLWACVDTPDSV